MRICEKGGGPLDKNKPSRTTVKKFAGLKKKERWRSARFSKCKLQLSKRDETLKIAFPPTPSHTHTCTHMYTHKHIHTCTHAHQSVSEAKNVLGAGTFINDVILLLSIIVPC